MKTRFAIAVFASLVLITLLVLGTLVSGMRRTGSPTPESQESAIEADSLSYHRQQVVFLLGQDELRENPYYRLAYQHYRSQPDSAEIQLVTHCRSLREVRDFLVENARGPWGNVHLVVHGNQWSGLSVPVTADGGRTSGPILTKALETGDFPVIPAGVLDIGSELIVHACGSGRDGELMSALDRAFGGEVTVRSSKYFICYEKDRELPDITRQYLSDYWFTTYQTGRRPIDPILAAQLEEENPGVHIDWMSALSREEPRWIGDVYHYRFSVPVNWVVGFSNVEEFPEVDSDSGRMAFLRSQKDLMARLERIGIPVDRFNWHLEEVSYTLDDGRVIPAIRIEGKSSILCVLRAITEEGSSSPLTVDLSDERFYAVIR